MPDAQAELAQDAPDVSLVIVHSAPVFDQLAHPARRPEPGRVSKRLGAASAPAGGRRSATKKPCGFGKEWVGRGLKKSAQRAAHHRLYRLERAERAAPLGAHLGAAGTDYGAAISCQLESALGRGRHLGQLLFPALPKHHSRAAEVVRSIQVEYMARLRRARAGRYWSI